MSSALEQLRREFRGDIIEPGQAEYESARRSVFAAGSPAYVVRPGERRGRAGSGPVRRRHRAGVVRARRRPRLPGLRHQRRRRRDRPRRARGRGRSSTSERHVVRIGGGATWGQVAAALAPYGLAISSGDTKSVGVGGLTLTGGIGWKVRKYGLALDNVVAAEVVTADGDGRARERRARTRSCSGRFAVAAATSGS